jgi:hypothetical protein
MLSTSIVRFVVAALIFGAYSLAANRPFIGVITDDMCARKHTMMPGNPDSDCVRACVKAGSKHAVLVGDRVYKLEGKAEQADRFAGQKVKLTGSVVGDTIHAVTLESAKW